MNEFVAYLVKNLVDRPDEVEIKTYEENQKIMVEIKVAQADVGKVIGRKGMTINALRTIIMTVCSRLGKRVQVELVECAPKELVESQETALIEN